MTYMSEKKKKSSNWAVQLMQIMKKHERMIIICYETIKDANQQDNYSYMQMTGFSKWLFTKFCYVASQSCSSEYI